MTGLGNYYCILCDSFIVDTSKPRKEINSEIFHHFFDMHAEDEKMRVEEAFSGYLRLEDSL